MNVENIDAAEKVLWMASSELTYQTSRSDGAEKNVNTLWIDRQKPFPLRGSLNAGDMDDIARIFKGRPDARELRDWLRGKAMGLYARSMSEFCSKHGINDPDLRKMKEAAADGHWERALAKARDVFEYGMDGEKAAAFDEFYRDALDASWDGKIEFNVEIGRSILVTVQIGTDMKQLGETRLDHPASAQEIAEALTVAFPAAADGISYENRDAPKM